MKLNESAYELSRLTSSAGLRARTRAPRAGISLVEIMISITILVLIATIGIVAANPAGQLAKSRNNDRQLQLEAVMNSIRQNISDSGTGSFSCSSGVIPTSTTRMANTTGSYNIAPCLVPIYLPIMPFDPTTSSAHWTSVTDYNSGYNIIATTSTPAVITVSAPATELKQAIISITR